MSAPDFKQVTALLGSAQNGDSGAARELLPIVYAELLRLARARMAHQPAEARLTLQPTALVHEAYLRLVGNAGGNDVRWVNRRQFFFAAAVAMRDILVERARQRASLKRGGGRGRLGLDHSPDLESDPETSGVDLVALDAALAGLAERDPRKGEIVMLRYFSGLSVDETALAMDVSPATVKREWSLAKALLFDALRHGSGGNPGEAT